jgi:acyl-CoA thioesterase II
LAIVNILATHNPHRFTLPVTSGVCVGAPGKQFLFGGAGLAASIAALEATTGRPTVWATAQYLSYARQPCIMDLDVIVPVSGKHTTQARVIGHVADTEILTVNAALGSRPGDLSGQWAVMPDIARPEDCPVMEPNWERPDDDIHSHIELRTAKGRFGAGRNDGVLSPDGHALLWARPRDASAAIDRASLAVFADFIPSGIGNALGRHAGANSLDNTIRYRGLVDTDWVLLDIRIHTVHAGFAHGRMHLFAQDGTLLATASQSMILRVRD